MENLYSVPVVASYAVPAKRDDDDNVYAIPFENSFGTFPKKKKKSRPVSMLPIIEDLRREAAAEVEADKAEAEAEKPLLWFDDNPARVFNTYGTIPRARVRKKEKKTILPVDNDSSSEYAVPVVTKVKERRPTSLIMGSEAASEVASEVNVIQKQRPKSMIMTSEVAKDFNGHTEAVEVTSDVRVTHKKTSRPSSLTMTSEAAERFRRDLKACSLDFENSLRARKSPFGTLPRARTVSGPGASHKIR